MQRSISFNPSSNITDIVYDDETQELTVTFGERSGVYSGVPESTAMGFESAPSAGRYLNEFIKPTFTYNRITG